MKSQKILKLEYIYYLNLIIIFKNNLKKNNSYYFHLNQDLLDHFVCLFHLKNFSNTILNRYHSNLNELLLNFYLIEYQKINFFYFVLIREKKSIF
jgi:hypothetical protein